MKNEKIKVLFAEENEVQKVKISEAFSDYSRFEILGFAKNGQQLLTMIENYNPDVVITDLLLGEIDGLSVMEKVIAKGICVKFLIISSLTSDTFVQKALSLNAEYYMIKPVSYADVRGRVCDMMAEKANTAKIFVKENTTADNGKAPVKRNRYMEEKITNIFITVGIPAHIKGYQFLREAIKMAIDNPEIINSITKELYPSIAVRFDTSASKVERAIRHAIEVAWNRGKIENINSVFGVKVYSNNEKPTNGEFIALVADKMLIEG
ncbi:MAG: sporulation transcription factor Spo0A [Clostridia bacterium]